MTRIFVYDDREFPDPEPEMSVEQVKGTLADFYGEIANASVKETKRGDDTTYEFQRRVGTKGSLTHARRRAPAERPEPSEPYALGDLRVDFTERLVSLAGRRVQLTIIEYQMLAELAVSSGRVVNHADLLQRVWGPAHSGGSGPVRTVVKNLRHKLGDDSNNPTYIFNEPRVGYRMPKETTASSSRTIGPARMVSSDYLPA